MVLVVKSIGCPCRYSAKNSNERSEAKFNHVQTSDAYKWNKRMAQSVTLFLFELSDIDWYEYDVC